MHGTFVAAGPGIVHLDDPVPDVRAIDLAPTVSFLLGIPGPQNARGRILYGLTKSPNKYKEITILDISDFHGQLVPLAEAADNLTSPPASTRPSPIGGSAFLKPWFDWYRNEAPNGSVLMAAGDSVGATPPISAFFGDTPTIEHMNLMGFQIDGLGNHNFDKGSAYLRNTLIPLADFPYVSANVVDANGKTPPSGVRRLSSTTRSVAARSASSASPMKTRRRSSLRVRSIRSTWRRGSPGSRRRSTASAARASRRSS